MSTRKPPPENSRFVAPLFELDRATSETLIVARRLQSGSYAFFCRQVSLRPFTISTYQLGQCTAGDPHGQSFWTAGMWAASLFSVDEEVQRHLS